MLALYRSGRQAEALAAYQAARSALVEELGIEPGRSCNKLERAMLQQDPNLDLVSEPPAAERSILVAVRAEDNLDALVGLAELLARTRPAREVILARLTAPEAMGAAAALLNRRREELASRGVAARTVAFTSSEPGEDLVRLASEQDTDLLLADGDFTETLGVDLATVLDRAPCDVALLVRKDGAGLGPAPDRPVLVPFGGADHDWAAVEVGAWIARASGASLLLAGAEGDPGLEKRDASRLLASASLLVQRAVGVGTEPLLVPRGPEGLIGASATAGLDRRWTVRQVARGRLGETRLAIAGHAACATLFVRRGLRPGGPGTAREPHALHLVDRGQHRSRLSSLSGLSAGSQRLRRPCPHGTVDSIQSRSCGGGARDGGGIGGTGPAGSGRAIGARPRRKRAASQSSSSGRKTSGDTRTSRVLSLGFNRTHALRDRQTCAAVTRIAFVWNGKIDSGSPAHARRRSLRSPGPRRRRAGSDRARPRGRQPEDPRCRRSTKARGHAPGPYPSALRRKEASVSLGRPSDRIGVVRLCLEALLGRGGMGVVYKAYDPR